MLQCKLHALKFQTKLSRFIFKGFLLLSFSLLCQSRTIYWSILLTFISQWPFILSWEEEQFSNSLAGCFSAYFLTSISENIVLHFLIQLPKHNLLSLCSNIYEAIIAPTLLSIVVTIFPRFLPNYFGYFLDL